MATTKQVQIVADMHRTFSERDVDGFVSHLTDDVVLRPSAFITGRGEYKGKDDVRAGFDEIADLLESRGEDVTVEPQRFYEDASKDDVVMSLARVTIIREDGETFGTDIAYLMEMRGDTVTAINAWLSFDEGLKQLENPNEVSP